MTKQYIIIAEMPTATVINQMVIQPRGDDDAGAAICGPARQGRDAAIAA